MVIFQSQIDKYQAYTDRYFKFKVQFRELMPLSKRKENYFLFADQAIDAFKQLGKAMLDASDAVKKTPLLTSSRWADVYNGIDDFHKENLEARFSPMYEDLNSEFRQKQMDFLFKVEYEKSKYSDDFAEYLRKINE